MAPMFPLTALNTAGHASPASIVAWRMSKARATSAGGTSLTDVENIPHRGAHHVGAGVVLVNGLHAQLAIDRREILDRGPDFGELREHGLLQVVLVETHAVVLDSQAPGRCGGTVRHGADRPADIGAERP